jgi:hypothetical protein
VAFLKGEDLQIVLTDFKSLNCADPQAADAFWGKFTPGNTLAKVSQPFERLAVYEELLKALYNEDETRYREMHKGTPFYFMAWLAFDLRNYQKALFYLDAAISEDVRMTKNTSNPDAWKNMPGTQFLLLANVQNVGQRTKFLLIRELGIQIVRFNKASGKPALDVADVMRFLERFLDEPRKRAIISALYIFILEFQEWQAELQLRRGSQGGSSEPFTMHLLSGGLLLESLLKEYYPVDNNGQPNKQIGKVFQTGRFLADFGLNGSISTSASTLREIYDEIAGSNSAQTAFTITGKIRNTTGHNLVWDDIFANEVIYTELYHQIVNAILYIVDFYGR